MSGAADAHPAPGAALDGPRMVTLADIRAAVGADAIWCPDLAVPVTGVVAADLMSDVLVDGRPGYVLVTGLANVQTIRTAAIADLAAVVFARGKAVPPEVIGLAQEMRVPIFTSPLSLFDAAGGLYATLRDRVEGAGEKRQA
jgi:hypothetical protein